ncbi:MAG TPA: SMP-30/gluconolactonase/LRE family protein [Chitinophagaceae bacterium]|nr:SMP-30/gluconolactonase/LRE family protein [Chitinophagaceae bacterium]
MERSTSVIKTFVGLMSCILVATNAIAHPGSGIVVDKQGQVYFTDTGKGVWKIDNNGKLTFLPASKFHWMTIDAAGHFAGSSKNFGEYFERVTPQNNKPTLLMCSDFPLVIGNDGNIYYANTRTSSGKIIRRTPGGKESVLISDKIFEFISGIAVGPDGSLYITEASDANANTIRKITMNGTMSIIATFVGKSGDNLPLETTPSYCRGIAVDSTGTIYVAATGSRSVLKISPNGIISNILQESSPWTPTGVTVFHGEIYILEWHDVTAENLEVRSAYIPRVRMIGSDGKITTIATVSR